MQDLCLVQSLGLMPYRKAWDLQRRIHSQVVEGRSPNVLLLLEHPHVYTLGRRGKPSDVLADAALLKKIGAEVHHVDRGGEVTYHGPGQLVGYAIINLRRWRGGPLKFVQSLERALICTLAEFGIQAESEDRPTGVWVGRAKIAAIGVRVSRGATMHGFALNVSPDLLYFEHIVACGLPEAAVTSMSQELERPPEAVEVVEAMTRCFGEAFGMRMEARS
ncbi:MAG: lipoyl(octanoyl) transferase LipB [Chloroflexi bacterium]|nr:lipoyl(octanoyl) transferase LipB [Chloroflexota bacterium]MCI0822792.1 lipoyl(octanoyl) transferase LipB [Chloroflexota bacterium]